MSLGRIFIALVAEGEVFDPVAHRRNDLDLVDARARWAEKDFWSVECDVAHDGGVFKLGGKTRVFISEEVDGVLKLSFIGRIEGWPIGPAGKVVSLTVMCKPVDAEAMEIAALAGINDDPWWLFSDPTDKRTSDVALAGRAGILHWGRGDLPPVVTDMLVGQGLIDVGANFIEGSLEFEQPAQPIQRVDVTIKAEWVQSLPLVIDLAQALGGDGFFGTISSPDWGEFPKAGEKIGDWTVIRSAVARRNPPGSTSEFSRVFNGYAKANRSLDAGKATVPTALRFQRMFFDVDLVATSVISANRRETLTFSLVWGGQRIAGYQGTTETIELECRNLRRDIVSGEAPAWQSGVGYGAGTRVQFDGAVWVCTAAHQSGSSLYAHFGAWDPLLFDYSPSGGQAPALFFGAPIVLSGTTPSGHAQQVFRNPTPGYHAVKFALGQARAKLISGVRIIRASFEVPWEDVRTITGRERIRIADPAIPGSAMVGKVVAVEAELIRGVARITIAAAPGNGGFEPIPSAPQYAAQGLFTQGIVSSAIVNPYQVQEQILAGYEAPGQYDLVAVAEGLRTSFNIALSPTSGQADMDRTIGMGTFTYDSDRMVDLSA